MCVNIWTIFSQSHVQNYLFISFSLHTYIFIYTQTQPLHAIAQNASVTQVQIHWCYYICAFNFDKGDRRNKRTNRFLLLKGQMKEIFLNIRIHLTLICLECCSQVLQCYRQRNQLNWDVALKHIFFKLQTQKLLNAIECINWWPRKQWKPKIRLETIQLGNSPTTCFHIRREIPKRFLLKYRLDLASM